MASQPDRLFRISDEKGWLGLSCGPGGLSLAGVSLLDTDAGAFANFGGRRGFGWRCDSGQGFTPRFT